MLACFGSSLARRLCHGCHALVAVVFLLAASPLQAATPGSVITSHARLSSAGVLLAQASVSIRVSANVAFLRYAPAASELSVSLAPTFCAGTARAQPAFHGVASGNLPLLPAAYPLATATEYRVGEPVFFLVEDAARNLDALVRDSLELTVSNTANGDSEVLLLAETGSDTGIFAGFVNTTEAVAAADCLLSVHSTDTIAARYEVDAEAEAVLVDPFGLVFDSASGLRIDNARVTLIDVASGQPAMVTGDAGEAYPNPVFTGTAFSTGVIDYQLRPGEYRFPYVPAGRDYRLEVDQLPPGYVFPTARIDADFASVPDGPYVVGSGSRGDVFNVPLGPPLRVDLPVDAAGSGLFVVKTASRPDVAIGDFVPFDVTVTNVLASAFTGVELRDVLPPGFRYRRGSLKIDGVQQPDPQIGGDGRELTIVLGTLAGNEARRLSYLTEVTAATPLGTAVNRARASSGAVISNEARATVGVREDLMRSRALLAGRVRAAESCAAEDLARAQPVPGARLYLEDGRYVLTDARGRWHFDNLRPGSHVLQLDENGLPEGSEILDCARNTRAAGNVRSRFVDVQGGTLWQEDFVIRLRRAQHFRMVEEAGQLSATLAAQQADGRLHFRLQIDHPEAALNGGELTVKLPPALALQPGSLRLDGAARADFTLPALPAGVHVLEWQLVPVADAADGVHAIDTVLAVEVAGQRIVLPPQRSEASLQTPDKVGRVIVFRPRFASFSTELAAADRRWLDDIVQDLRNAGDIRMEVVGHTDDVPVVPRAGRAINDNHALSQARAQSVADYLAQKLKLPPERIAAFGRGPDEPLAEGKTPEVRARNRRVELKVYAAGRTEAQKLALRSTEAQVRQQRWSRWRAEEVDPATVAPVEAEPVLPADEATGILSHRDGDVLASRIQAVRVRVDSRLKAVLLLDGKPVDADRLGFIKNEGKTTLMSFVGVDLGEPGRHVLTLKGTDTFGNERLSQSLTLQVAAEITRLRAAAPVANVADGRTPVQLKVELVDGAGRTVPAAVEMRVVSGELRPLQTDDRRRTLAQSAGKITIGADGTLKFAPVTRSGLYMVELAYGNVVEKFPVYVRPEKREWILVALAEGSLAARTLGGNMQSAKAAGASDDLFQDGRVAFFAKGQIKGEWLLTVAYDSDRERAASFGGAINPEQFYTLYADASDPAFDAPSREKLYLRIEKDAFHALFGDFNTGLTEVELGRYSRTLTGLKSEYHDARFDLNVFAADTGQAYLRDELRGDGTSGLYRLRSRNILNGSDRVLIEVRDRFNPTVIVSSQQLARWADYHIDYDSGTVFFKSPVPVQDSDLNPVWIVAEYEVESRAGDALNAGGRAAVKFLDGRAVVGVTAVQEKAGLNSGRLTALDASWKVSAVDTLKLEVADSSTESALGSTSGGAQLLEWKRDSQLLKSRVYYREQEAGFGLGQLNAGEEGSTRLGAEGRYQLRQHLSLFADVSQQELSLSGNERLVADFRAEFNRDASGYSVGLRHVAERFGDAAVDDRSADQLTLGGRYHLPGNRVKLRANAELGLAASSESEEFPDRLLVGADYQLNKRVQLSLEEEWAWASERVVESTRFGVVYQPWQGARIGTSLSREAAESAERLRAGLGLGQNLVLGPAWTLDFGYDRADTLKDEGATDFNPGVPDAFGPATADFWVASVGANFQRDDIRGVGRIERREADDEKRWNLVGGLYRELNPELAIAGGLTTTLSERDDGSVQDSVLLRGSVAWRPEDGPWLVLNRTDLGLDRQQQAAGADLDGRRLVNNLNANRRWEHNQLSLQYGAKFVFDTIDDTRVEGYTDLIGVEWRRDLSERWDIGWQSSLLHSWEPGVMDYSYGLSVGMTPARNAWISVGYNLEGFTDADFSGAEYTAQGLYLKLRVKLDQDSVRELWNNRRGVFR